MNRSKKLVSIVSIVLVELLFTSSVTVFAGTKTIKESCSLYRNRNQSTTITAKEDTDITINYDLGSDSASGTVCFDISKQQWGPFYRSVYVKTVKANTSGTLTFTVDETTKYNVSITNNSEKPASVMGIYEITYYELTGRVASGSFK